MERSFLRLPALLVIVALLAACAAPMAMQATPQAMQSPQPVRIGAIYPLSGALAVPGQECRNGVELAVQVINGAYPQLNLPSAADRGLPSFGGAPLEVTFADNADNPTQSYREAQRLISAGAVALIGSYSSSTTVTASEAAELRGVPFVADTSSATNLTQRGFRWFFRTSPNDAMASTAMFQFLDDMKAAGRRVDTVATIYNDTLFGTDSSRSENEEANRRGYRVVANIQYPAGATDLSAQVQALKAASPDVVIPSSYIDGATRLTREMKAQGFAPQAVLAQDAGYVEAAYLQAVGADAEGILSRDVFNVDLAQKLPLIGQVNALYRQRYGTDLNGVSARAFMGTIVLADAINRAGSTQPEAIRAALAATDIPAPQVILPWSGVRFDSSGQNTLAGVIIVQVQGGKYSTVWPVNLAAKPVVWPAS